ncbi:hypothetical protein [Streptomyces malaysiensis]|nr:hypothetical protein [Streptomyces sp. HNM0561]
MTDDVFPDTTDDVVPRMTDATFSTMSPSGSPPCPPYAPSP